MRLPQWLIEPAGDKWRLVHPSGRVAIFDDEHDARACLRTLRLDEATKAGGDAWGAEFEAQMRSGFGSYNPQAIPFEQWVANLKEEDFEPPQGHPKAWATLGLQPGASTEEIKAAYRKRVKEVHPDHGGDPKAFRWVQRSYEHLMKLFAGAA